MQCHLNIIDGRGSETNIKEGSSLKCNNLVVLFKVHIEIDQKEQRHKMRLKDERKDFHVSG